LWCAVAVGGVPGYSAGTNLPRRLRADLKIHEVL
jgi:hypothetical protein